MKRIAVIGVMGAGKSTLSRILGDKLGIEVIHLDKIFWLPGWVKIIPSEGIQIQLELVKRDKWIIDGNWAGSGGWTGSLDIRLDAADTIIFLDFPKIHGIFRTLKRLWMYRNMTPFDKAEGVKERVSWRLFFSIINYPRKEILQKLRKHAKTKDVFIFRNQKAVNKFLNSLTG